MCNERLDLPEEHHAQVILGPDRLFALEVIAAHKKITLLVMSFAAAAVLVAFTVPPSVVQDRLVKAPFSFAYKLLHLGWTQVLP